MENGGSVSFRLMEDVCRLGTARGIPGEQLIGEDPLPRFAAALWDLG